MDIRQQIQKMRPIDDTFFEVLIEDKLVCQEILRVVMEDDSLEVLEVVPQRSMRNLGYRSVRLDAYCKLGDSSLCNIEVQRSNNDDQHRRARYNAASIVTKETNPGQHFHDIPNVYVVIISEFDIFRKGRMIYHTSQCIEETGDFIFDGERRIYLNTENADNSEIGLLMKAFMQTQVDAKKYPYMHQRIHHLKESEKGVGYMCEIMKEIVDEEIKEIAIRMLQKGSTIEFVSECTGLDSDCVKKIEEELRYATTF